MGYCHSSLQVLAVQIRAIKNGNDFPCVVVENKNDLEAERAVSQQEGTCTCAIAIVVAALLQPRTVLALFIIVIIRNVVQGASLQTSFGPHF